MTVRKIEGLDQVIANLKALPAEIAGKGGGPLRKALFQGAKVIRDDARSLAPVGDDGDPHVRDQIVLKRDPNPRATDNAAERYIVTVKYRKKKYKNNRKNRRAGKVGKTYQNFGDFYYWRHLEFGHRTSKGNWVQEPFMRPAFERNKNALSGITRDVLSVEIAAIVKKLKK